MNSVGQHLSYRLLIAALIILALMTGLLLITASGSLILETFGVVVDFFHHPFY